MYYKICNPELLKKPSRIRVAVARCTSCVLLKRDSHRDIFVTSLRDIALKDSKSQPSILSIAPVSDTLYLIIQIHWPKRSTANSLNLTHRALTTSRVNDTTHLSSYTTKSPPLPCRNLSNEYTECMWVRPFLFFFTFTLTQTPLDIASPSCNYLNRDNHPGQRSSPSPTFPQSWHKLLHIPPFPFPWQS